MPSPPLPESVGRYRVRGVLGRGGMGVVYDAEDPERSKRVALKTVLGLRTKYVQAVRREIHALARLRHPGIVAIVDEGTHEGAPWYAMEYVDGVTLRAWARGLALAPEVSGPPPFVDAPLGEPPDDTAFVEALRTGILASDAPTLTHAGSAFAAHRPAAIDPSMVHVPPAPEVGDSTATPSRTGTGQRLSRRSEPATPETLPAILRVVRRLCATLEYLHGEGLVHRDLKPDNVIVRAGAMPVA